MLTSLRAALASAALRITGGARRPGEPPLVRPPLPYLGHALAMGRDLSALLREVQRVHMGREIAHVIYQLLYGESARFGPTRTRRFTGIQNINVYGEVNLFRAIACPTQ